MLKRFALIVTMLFSTAALADSTVYYRGVIGEEPWQLELSIDGTALRGRLLHDLLPLQLEAGGTFSPEDSSLVARFVYGDPEQQGTLLGETGPDGSMSGTFLSGDLMQPFRFEQVAHYVDYTFRQERIEATSTYPFFTSRRLSDLNAYVQPDLMAEQIAFVQAAQEADIDGDIRSSWWFDSRATLEYAAPGLLSSLVTVSEYQGGAHPSLDYWAYNLVLTGTRMRPFYLADLFLPDSDWLDEVSDLVLAALREQQADWVLNGTVTGLDEDDLQVFLLSPAGVQFILAPYQVGPWVAGTFTVRIPLEQLAELLDPEGPVRMFRATETP